jgi:hypothetical protein
VLKHEVGVAKATSELLDAVINNPADSHYVLLGLSNTAKNGVHEDGTAIVRTMAQEGESGKRAICSFN